MEFEGNILSFFTAEREKEKNHQKKQKTKEKQEGIQYRTGIGMEDQISQKRKRSIQNISEDKLFHCTISGCLKKYISAGGLKKHQLKFHKTSK